MNLLTVTLFALSALVVRGSYVAGVLDHEEVGGATPSAIKSANLALYASAVASAAAHAVQVLVLPEFGLGVGKHRDDTRPFGEYLPANTTLGSTNPCALANASTPALTNISCLAQQYKLMIDVNLVERHPCNGIFEQPCPDDGEFLFNTNVVFGESGNIIAVYRKTHPWFTKTFDHLQKVEHVTLDAFGVRFGLFTCKDILYEDPAVTLVKMGVKHFLYSVEVRQHRYQYCSCISNV